MVDVAPGLSLERAHQAKDSKYPELVHPTVAQLGVGVMHASSWLSNWQQHAPARHRHTSDCQPALPTSRVGGQCFHALSRIRWPGQSSTMVFCCSMVAMRSSRWLPKCWWTSCLRSVWAERTCYGVVGRPSHSHDDKNNTWYSGRNNNTC